MKLKKIKSKKGVSPVIATMLLIGIVVVLAILIFLWLKGFTREVVTKNLGFGEKNIELVCEDVVLTANYEYLQKKLLITNQGSAPVEAIEMKIFSTDNTYEILRIKKDDNNVKVKQGKTISLNLGELNTEKGTKDLTSIEYKDNLLIIPVLLGNSEEGGTKEHKCEERYWISVNLKDYGY